MMIAVRWRGLRLRHFAWAAGVGLGVLVVTFALMLANMTNNELQVSVGGRQAPPLGPLPMPSWEVFWLGSQLLLVVSLAIFTYSRLRGSRFAREALAQAEAKRVEDSRRIMTAKLKAIQAQVEPRFLFRTLESIERLYVSDRRAADTLMDDLIAYLRAALPHLRGESSTLGVEMKLVQSYLRIVRFSLGVPAADVDVPAELGDVAFPPMVLLPLIEPRASARTIRLAATRVDGAARITIEDDGHDIDDAQEVEGVRARLKGVSVDASLEVRPGSPQGRLVTIQVRQ